MVLEFTRGTIVSLNSNLISGYIEPDVTNSQVYFNTRTYSPLITKKGRHSFYFYTAPISSDPHFPRVGDTVIFSCRRIREGYYTTHWFYQKDYVYVSFKDARSRPRQSPIEDWKWRTVLGFLLEEPVTEVQVTERFRKLVKTTHPDHVPGKEKVFNKLVAARDIALTTLK
jgi:hypothetical protein